MFRGCIWLRSDRIWLRRCICWLRGAQIGSQVSYFVGRDMNRIGLHKGSIGMQRGCTWWTRVALSCYLAMQLRDAARSGMHEHTYVKQS